MSTSLAWEHELQSWLEPFLTHLRHPARRRMCPLYVAGLIGPGQRTKGEAEGVARLAELQPHLAPSSVGHRFSS